MTKCSDYNVTNEKAYCIDLLKRHKARITSQRESLLDFILRFKRPFSADELHKKVVKSKIDLVTVYRALSFFEEIELVTSVNFDDGISRFEYKPSQHQHHHHHIVCTKCKKVEPLHDCSIDSDLKKLKKMGYTNISHRLEFFALCKACS